jgi:hypothetical protein
MGAGPKGDQDASEETTRRRDDALRRMFNTPLRILALGMICQSAFC